MTLGVPYTFVPGTKAKANEVNANFASVLEEIDKKLNKDCSNLSEEAINIIKTSISTRNFAEIVYSSTPLNDSNLHLLDGTILQYGGVYTNFVRYIADLYTQNPNANFFTTENHWQQSIENYGMCAKFVYNESAKTVRLPKIGGVMELSTEVDDLGNINRYGTSQTSNNFVTSFKGFAYIVVATVPKTEIELDIDNIATDLNQKLDNDTVNLSTRGKIALGKLSLPSNKSIEITLGASDTHYVPPADGWFSMLAAVTAANGVVYLRNHSIGVVHIAQNYVKSQYATPAMIPCKKGDDVSLAWQNSTISYLRFHYAQGSESEAS